MAIPRDNPKEIKKATIYIDIDDEITSIIEKLQNSQERIVALVLPKRASVLQSVVNMKLLKRSAENAKKHIVLITSEAGLLPLAGAVGLHVASSLQSKPAIPASPDMIQREQVIDEETGEEFEDFDSDTAADEPIGKLAGVAPASTFTEPETIELGDDEIPSATTGADAGAAAASAPKKGKNKKLKVPNFNRFRILLIGGIALLLLLIGGFVYANTALSKATITLKTNSTDIDTKASLTLDPKATEVDIASNTLPAKLETKVQTGSQQVGTSGEKNNGTKSTGTVSVSQVCTKKPAPVDAGTGYSAGNLTFISTQQLQLNTSGGFDSDGNIVCKGDVEVVAQQAGAKFNVAAGTKFTVAGNPGASGINGAGFTGGTENIVKIVAQADIDSAKAKITGADSAGVKDDLSKKLQAAGYIALPTSLHVGDPTVSPSAAAGDQADTVTVTSSTTYTMYGLKKADVKTIITTNVTKQINTSKQQILQDGVNAAKYDITTVTASGPLQITMTATSLAGPNIQLDKLPAQLAGKRTGEVQSMLKAIPGVSDVTVKYSPFWVSKVPTKPSKVIIVVEKAAVTNNK